MSLLTTVGTALGLIKKVSDSFSLYIRKRKEKRLREYNKAAASGDTSTIKRIFRNWL